MTTQTSPTEYRPDLYRRFAELLVEVGLLPRREVELALRSARRTRLPLAQWLIRNGRIPSGQLSTVRRLETLLAQRPTGYRLTDVLLDSGEISRTELRRALEMRQRTGLPLAEIVARQGWLGRPRRPHLSPWTLSQPLAAAAMLAMVTGSTWLIGQSDLMLVQSASAMAAPRLPAGRDQDLRFASLGDITPHLQRLRQRPAPYRAPPRLTSTVVQRAKKLRPLVNRHARRFALPPALILAMIERESSFNPDALSPKKGVGLMQLVPHSGGREAWRYSHRRSYTPTLKELQDPSTNIRLGSAYLRLLLDRHFDDIKDEDVRVAVALAAYNWGPTRMRRALALEGLPQSLDEVETLLEKHAPRETQRYVREITYRMDAFG